MKIYTKKGDQGETSLFGGKRLPKSHYRIEAYGTIDELNAHIGLVRDHTADNIIQDNLVAIQEDLFTLGSWVAADPDKVDKLKLPEFQSEKIQALESKIDQMEETLPPMKNFILPGGHVAVSTCHVARCVCRRAERCLVNLKTTDHINPVHLQYLNRLSDYLFVLSRKLSKDNNANETPWQPFNK